MRGLCCQLKFFSDAEASDGPKIGGFQRALRVSYIPLANLSWVQVASGLVYSLPANFDPCFPLSLSRI